MSAQLLAPPHSMRAEIAFIRADARWQKAHAKAVEAEGAIAGLAKIGATPAAIRSARARWSRADDAQGRVTAALAVAFRGMRQPWQMTRAEWEREMEALQPDQAGSACRRPWHPRNLLRVAFLRSFLPWRQHHSADGARQDSTPPTHRDVVAQAIAEGCPVPAEVRAEYAARGAA